MRIEEEDLEWKKIQERQTHLINTGIFQEVGKKLDEFRNMTIEQPSYIIINKMFQDTLNKNGTVAMFYGIPVIFGIIPKCNCMVI